MHELEHVRRGDWVSQCLARVVRAVYWFHPLVWMAWRQLALEAERSCDDAVLGRSEATAYAEQLVKLARRLSSAAKAPTAKSPLLAMANRADLTTRVGAVLDSQQQRGRAGLVPVTLVWATGAALVITMSPLRMVAAPQSASSQTATTEELRFEVASVKPAQSASGRFTMNGGPGTSDPGRIGYTNIMLRRILLSAYEVKNYQISGPDWLDTLRFDITAKVPDGTTKDQFQSMLRNLLATRFKMTIHRESKELPIYALLVAKNGPKIKATAEDAGSIGKLSEDQLAMIQPREGKDGFPALSLRAPGLVIETKSGRARVTAKGVPTTKLADLLSGQVGRPVIDMTGLAGNYSFVVYFTPEGSDSADGSEPSVFGALQEQLGLRLEARKGPVELLMIDHAEKVPTEN